MHEAALAQAALPAPTVVLGLLLRPYSLGHELFLTREDNPILTDRLVEMKHLVQASLFCCQTFAESKAMNGDWFLGLKMKLWRRRLKAVSLERELAAFKTYLEQGSLEFRMSGMPRPGSRMPGRQPGAPFLLRLHQFLVTRLGLNEAAAWDYPYGLAKMQWGTYWECEGGLELHNEHEAQFDAFVAEQEAKVKGSPSPRPSPPGEGERTTQEAACPV